MSQPPRYFALRASVSGLVETSRRTGTWVCHPNAQKKLTDAATAGATVVLVWFFRSGTALSSNVFCGYGRMTSGPVPALKAHVPWDAPGSLGDPFAVEWLCHIEVPIEEVATALQTPSLGSLKDATELEPALALQIGAMLDHRARMSVGGAGVPPPGASALPPMLPMMPMGVPPRPVPPPPPLGPGAVLGANPFMPGNMGWRPAPPPGGVAPGAGPVPAGADRSNARSMATRGDLMFMSYQRYREVFERVYAKEGAPSGGGEGSPKEPEDELMTEEEYMAHCEQFTKERGMPFDPEQVRQHYAAMVAELGAK